MTNNKEPVHMYGICVLLIIVATAGILSFQKSGTTSVTGSLILEETELRSTFQFNPPAQITRTNALQALIESEDHIVELQNYNRSVLFVNDTLLQAKRFYIGHVKNLVYDDIAKENDQGRSAYLKEIAVIAEKTPTYEVKKLNLTEVHRLTQLIVFSKQQTFDILDQLTVLKEKEKHYRNNKVDTTEARKILHATQKSFEEERYDEAQTFLEEADIKLDKARLERSRIKGMVAMSKNFIERNWITLLITLIILGIIAKPLFKHYHKEQAKKKLAHCHLELATLKKMIAKTQEAYFSEKSITKQTYDIRTERYHEKITQIKQKLPVLEAIACGHKPKKNTSKKRKGVLEIKK
jgi:hypothetical protein